MVRNIMFETFVSERAHIWQMRNVLRENVHEMYCSDGFFLNLSAIMVKLCHKLTPGSDLLLKIDPTYPLATVDPSTREKVHLKGMILHNTPWIFRFLLNRPFTCSTFLVIDLHDTSIVSLTSEEDEDVDRIEEEKVKVSPSYQTLTEGFFMTHYCLKIGLNVLLGRRPGKSHMLPNMRVCTYSACSEHTFFTIALFVFCR